MIIVHEYIHNTYMYKFQFCVLASDSYTIRSCVYIGPSGYSHYKKHKITIDLQKGFV